MHPDRVIVYTYRWSDGSSMRPYDLNNLTHQSASTNDFPRDPLCGPVTWNTVHFMDMLRLRIHSWNHRCRQSCHKYTFTLQYHPFLYLISHCEPRHWNRQFLWSTLLTRFNLRFSIWLDSISFLV